ncbi:aldehyde dehydrogenase PuuC, partial [Halomonas elongata]
MNDMTRSETPILATEAPETHADWRALAERLRTERGLETRAYVDDAFVEAIGGETFTTANPATGEPL